MEMPQHIASGAPVDRPSGPRLAVVVPIFRHSALLPEAIECALGQVADFPIRVVLVNDGCPHPETDSVCLDYARSRPDRIVYLRKRNGGLGDARNHGIRHVLAHDPTVEAIYLLDADNRLRPQAMARAMAMLDADPDLGWVYPDIDMFGLAAGHDYGGPYSRLIHSAMNICEAGSLVRREVFEAGVMFDTSFAQGFEDWDFFLSAGAAGFRGANLEDLGFLYRKRPESMLAEAERERPGIRAALRRKHEALLLPRCLVGLEHREAPRYAIVLADRGEVVLTTDPSRETERIDWAEHDRRTWQAVANPSRFGAPPFTVVTTGPALERLTGAGMLHWVFWRLETLADEAGVAALTIETHDRDRIAVSGRAAAQGQHLAAQMVMTRSRVLRDVLTDAGSAWIDSLSSPSPAPEVRQLTLTLPLRRPPADARSGVEMMFDFLAIVHRLRGSVWRDGAMQPVEWREGDVALRESSHVIPRERVGDAPVFPRVDDGRRHVGLTIPLVEFGGVEKVALNVARELKRAGFGVHLFVLAAESAAITPEWAEALDSVNFVSGTGFAPWGGGDRHYLGTELPGQGRDGDHAMLSGLLHWLDMVIDFHGGATAAVMGRLRKLGVRTAASLHLADRSPLQRPVGNIYLAVAYEHAFDHFLPCSQHVADWLHAMGVPGDKIVPLPNAPSFPLPEGRAARDLTERATRDPAAPLRVMFLGRLDPQKGLERLSSVVERSAGMNLTWRIIGRAVLGGGRLSPGLTRLIEPALSTPEDLADAYAWADVVVLLSDYEGLPLTILEAMRQGAVVIGTDVGAVSEVVRHGENGVIVPLSTAVADCLSALARLSQDRALLRRLSDRAAADMDGRDWGAATAGLLAAMRGTAGSRPA